MVLRNLNVNKVTNLTLFLNKKIKVLKCDMKYQIYFYLLLYSKHTVFSHRY